MSFPEPVRRIVAMDKKKRRAKNHLARCTRCRYGKHSRFSRKDLIDFLRSNDIYTTYALRRKRKTGDPKVYNYYKEFGTWDDVRLAVWGDVDVIGAAPMDDPEYQIRVVRDWGLYSAKAYRAARVRAPKVIPSFRRVLTQWGRFSHLVEAALRSSFKGQVVAFLKLREKLGKTPTAKDCRDSYIEYNEILSTMGSVSALNHFLAVYDKRRGK